MPSLLCRNISTSYHYAADDDDDAGDEVMMVTIFIMLMMFIISAHNNTYVLLVLQNNIYVLFAIISFCHWSCFWQESLFSNRFLSRHQKIEYKLIRVSKQNSIQSCNRWHKSGHRLMFIFGAICFSPTKENI